VYIRSVAGFSCIAGGAIGNAEISGGRSPASISGTRHARSSDRRDAITAPADPPPTTMKSNSSAMSLLPGPADGADIFRFAVFGYAPERFFFHSSKSRLASSPAAGKRPINERPRETSSSANSS
jgi:hypothetical protein